MYIHVVYNFIVLDTDECTDTTLCGLSLCVNMPGSYSCQCNNGMNFDPNSFSCIRKYLTMIINFITKYIIEKIV